VVSYNPNTIKSAIGNQGTYDTSHPDLNKARGGEVHMAGGGDPLDEFSPPRYRSAGRRPESQNDRRAAANMPMDFARGVVSGIGGAPGDIESLIRMIPGLERSQKLSNLVTGDHRETYLPTSEEIEKRIPLRSNTPAGRAASGLGTLAGGFYTGPGAPIRLVGGLPQAIKHGAQEFAMASTKGIPKMFIGPKAKTWDQAKADAAARMEQSGVDPVEIWRQTGTFRGADGIPRQEISDANAVYRLPYETKNLGKQKKQEALELGMSMITPIYQKDMFPKALTEAKKPIREQVKRLKEEADLLARDPITRGHPAKFVYEHPELYKAYPELAEMNVTQGGHGMMGERASLSGGKGDQQMSVTLNGLSRNPKSSVLHEMQHAVQTLEDMAPGGNTVTAFQNPEANKILNALRKDARTPMSFDDFVKKGAYFDDPETLARAAEDYKDYVDDVPLLAQKYDRDYQQRAAEEYYTRLAGEAEARATQAREPMSASQRAVEYPYSSYDVLPEDLIVKDPKGLMASMQMGPSNYRSVNTGDRLGDLTVGEKISNRGSISASGISNVLPGVRAVPMSSFEVTAPRDLFYAVDDINRVTALAEQIKQSGRIDPMIVGVDEKGNYIIEGAHRLGALNLLGAKEFPALIAIEDGVKGFAHGGVVRMGKGGAAKEIVEGAIKGVKKLFGAADEAPAGVEPIVVKQKVDHPLVFPRAAAKTKEDIRPIAQRMAEQVTGDFVRQNPKLTTNPVGKSRKQYNREQEIPLETRRLTEEKPVPFVDYESKKGNILLGVPGDPTLGGVAKRGSLEESTKPTVELTRVGDITPDSPVPLFGGPRYGDEEKFWASNYGAAAPIQNNANELAKLYEAPVLGQYIKMAPGSENFAVHNLDALLAIQQPEKLNKSNLRSLNSLIKQGSLKYGKFPGFAGFEDPIDVLLQAQLNPKLRKHIAEVLTKPTITDSLGLPSGLDVVAAITHPQLRNLETGASGFSIGEMRPGSDLRQFRGAHPTYDTDIPGSAIGQSRYPIPVELAFPDTTAYARSQMKPGVQEFNMIKMLGPRERIDQQYIDEIKMYEELMKEYTGKKKGGAVKKPKKPSRAAAMTD
jgi:hypothetical protein